MSQTFGPLLKDWRARRRLSQLSLGLKANVSARHVAFLETGRARPSRAMVLLLAEALEMPLTARNGFLDSAGFAMAYQRRALADADMSAVRLAIDWSLKRHLPFPAFAKDRHWNLVVANTVAAKLLAGAGIQPGDSLLELMTDEARLMQSFANPGEVGRHMLQRLRIESAYFGGDPVLDVAAEKLARSPTIAAFQVPSALPPVVPARYRAGGTVLSFFSTLAQFGTAEDLMLADLQIEFLFPDDDATRQFVEALA